jgi:hypothetical protein
MRLSEIIRQFIDTPFKIMSEEGKKFMLNKNKNSKLIARSLTGSGLEGMKINGNFYQISKYWKGESSEYFKILKNSIQKRTINLQ